MRTQPSLRFSVHAHGFWRGIARHAISLAEAVGHTKRY
jgi:hypothetical protein